MTMLTWVYYLDRSASGVVMLYRVREDLDDPRRLLRTNGQVYNRNLGWIDDDEFVDEMNRTGFVGQDDVISEPEAEAIIADLGRKANRQSPGE